MDYPGGLIEYAVCIVKTSASAICAVDVVGPGGWEQHITNIQVETYPYTPPFNGYFRIVIPVTSSVGAGTMFVSCRLANPTGLLISTTAPFPVGPKPTPTPAWTPTVSPT